MVQLTLPTINTVKTKFDLVNAVEHPRYPTVYDGKLLVCDNYDEPLHFISLDKQRGIAILQEWSPNRARDGKIVELPIGSVLGIHISEFY